MVIIPDLEELIKRGLGSTEAEVFQKAIVNLNSTCTPEQIWQWIYTHLLKPFHPVSVHSYLHSAIFSSRTISEGPAPAWIPHDKVIKSSNIYWLMKKTGKETFKDLYQWSVSERNAYWQTVVERLNILFKKKYSSVLDLSNGIEKPQWCKDASINIVDSCFQAPNDAIAIVYQDESNVIKNMSIKDLKMMATRVACSLVDNGIKKGDRIAVIMPMTVEAVAFYLGAILAGCTVVTIADSFVPEEMSVRLKIAPCRFVFTQDFSFRDGKTLPLYDKRKAAAAPPAIVFSKSVPSDLREGDVLRGMSFYHPTEHFYPHHVSPRIL